MNEFWHSAQETWQALAPEVQLSLRVVGVLVATFIADRAIGSLVSRRLRTAHFDAAFRRPWLPAPATGRPEPHTITPTRLVTGLVRLTVWGGGLWCMARLFGSTELTHGLQWFAGRVWSFAGVILGALYLSRLFSEKLVEVVQASALRDKLDKWLPPTGREPRVSGAATVAGILVDAVVILLVSLVAADLMGWALTGTALAAAWQLILHVAAASVALLIGWAGARWVRTQVVADPASSPTRVGHYAGTGVMGCATVLAIFLLAGNYPTYFGLILLVLFVMLLWPAQHWLPDIYAGVLLRVQKVKEVQIDGGVHRLGVVGLVQTQLLHPDGIRTRRNREVLDAHLASPSTVEEPHSEAGDDSP